jgi:hypothetical protein
VILLQLLVFALFILKIFNTCAAIFYRQNFLYNATAHFKNVNNCLNTNIYSYLETCGGQSFNLYLNVVHFLTPVQIIHLWHLKTGVFMHWCLICGVLSLSLNMAMAGIDLMLIFFLCNTI